MIKRFIEEVKFRWTNEKASLPGELREDKGVKLVFISEIPDIEKYRILRKFRGLLGYGPGWRFYQALLDFLFIPILVLTILFIYVLLLYCYKVG